MICHYKYHIINILFCVSSAYLVHFSVYWKHGSEIISRMTERIYNVDRKIMSQKIYGNSSETLDFYFYLSIFLLFYCFYLFTFLLKVAIFFFFFFFLSVSCCFLFYEDIWRIRVETELPVFSFFFILFWDWTQQEFWGKQPSCKILWESTLTDLNQILINDILTFICPLIMQTK